MTAQASARVPRRPVGRRKALLIDAYPRQHPVDWADARQGDPPMSAMEGLGRAIACNAHLRLIVKSQLRMLGVTWVRPGWPWEPRPGIGHDPAQRVIFTEAVEGLAVREVKEGRRGRGRGHTVAAVCNRPHGFLTRPCCALTLLVAVSSRPLSGAGRLEHTPHRRPVRGGTAPFGQVGPQAADQAIVFGARPAIRAFVLDDQDWSRLTTLTGELAQKVR